MGSEMCIRDRRFLDSSYDRLYSELADIELRAIRIKKILGRAGQKPGGGN